MISSKSIEDVNLPNGDYKGVWDENMVTVPFTDTNVSFKVDVKIKGIPIPVDITINNKMAYVKFN